jgi:Ca-activated chloride channel family protein
MEFLPIEFLWPWLLPLLPLPWLARRWLPPAHATGGAALKVPFFPLLQKLNQRSEPGGHNRGLLPAWGIWILLVTAAAQPVWLGEPGRIPTTGRDMMLVIDISGSMGQMDFFTDDEQQVDRLSMVRRVAGRFIEQRRGDRLGLILFGDKPYLRAPLTFDRAAVKQLLDEAEVTLAGEYTAIGDAIGLAVKRMRELPAQSRVVVLLSDGANNAGSLGPQQAAMLASELGVRIYAVGIGRQEVVAPNPYGVWSSEGLANFEREVLEGIAQMTGGLYFHALDSAGLEAAYARLDELEPTLGKDARTYLATPLYPWPLGAALLLSLAVMLRLRQPWRRVA